MVIVLALILFILFLPVPCERHLQYVYTTSFSDPKFSAVCLYDDRRISHYSDKEQNWKRDGQYSEIWRDTKEPYESRDWFIHLFNTLANCTSSECDGLHTLQRRIGCEMDAATNVNAFDEYRYDGEDFIAFNYNTRQWMEKKTKAKEIKMKWDNQSVRRLLLLSFLKNCLNKISTFNDSISNAPDVYIFASDVSHDQSKLYLSCLATGFYPKHIEMKITLNGIKLQPSSSTGVRPNEDETFQMRISVEIHRDEKEGYECHVLHRSQTNTTSWDGTCNLCSIKPRRHDLAKVAVGAFSVVVLLILLKIFKRWLNSQRNCNGSSTRSENIKSRLPELLKATDSPKNHESDSLTLMNRPNGYLQSCRSAE